MFVAHCRDGEGDGAGHNESEAVMSPPTQVPSARLPPSLRMRKLSYFKKNSYTCISLKINTHITFRGFGNTAVACESMIRVMTNIF